ncbi:hypothetical protein B0H67DRAFT_263879 [Lasiosphaeris hirsuta]|uniref:Uncharacterized protein n=1 Tax=Lasiosphaeris hirsuta TaxID=260670 RepID=A0AA40DRL5_9PEZI|nr:hypothetical protein B0H67DRAFT_263879 [Lasiosphaeris hirsuta]
MSSSIQEYFDAAENWERPRAVSTNTPRHPPSASRTARHASNPGTQQRVPARSSRETRETRDQAPSAQNSRGTLRPAPSSHAARGSRRSTQTIQDPAPRSPREIPAPSHPSRDPFFSSQIDREGDDPPPPPYEPLPPRPGFAGSRNALNADSNARVEMAAGLEVVEPQPISGCVMRWGRNFSQPPCCRPVMVPDC